MIKTTAGLLIVVSFIVGATCGVGWGSHRLNVAGLENSQVIEHMRTDFETLQKLHHDDQETIDTMIQGSVNLSGRTVIVIPNAASRTVLGAIAAGLDGGVRGIDRLTVTVPYRVEPQVAGDSAGVLFTHVDLQGRSDGWHAPVVIQ